MIPESSLKFMAANELEVEPLASISESEAAAEPQVFVRTLSAPPGWPWEQRRGVELEARHGAPLPISELLYRVRRLDAWRPGGAGRFAVFYVAARDVRDQLEARAEVDGREIAVTFGRAASQAARTGQVAAHGVAIALCIALAVGAVGAAMAKRAEATAALEIAEQKAAATYRQARARERLREEQRLLELQLERGAPLRDVVDDIAWASIEKAEGIQVEALRWRRDLMALEIRGERRPFDPEVERRVERSNRPIRKGVWLWGVGPGEAERRP